MGDRERRQRRTRSESGSSGNREEFSEEQSGHQRDRQGEQQ
jgi:hypothetical protein